MSVLIYPFRLCFDTRLSSTNYVVLFGYGVFSVCLLYQLFFTLIVSNVIDVLSLTGHISVPLVKYHCCQISVLILLVIYHRYLTNISMNY
ncbi:hypothetical protein HanXRQr2_Chr08g0345361 [Helianthus annuus]|uniref:Uncharacterized protein n=1 Tax=Helianthus annuus TaxID=4232 RepID=A0A9K3ND67_HELAN|nr:hypothetical protein HanXRQr2_Chr08g0345361 [Helianthus annuus]KAJ0539362.1 hypothetical protein HanHA300_Chr08g0285461 [Helianthus annuus]KAJ0554025.1 hypothetical protein HanHA89_Chr08g0302971 [Helianthus annuus]KAJ0902160.1 hypothetical protein HanPSC8_Chr08g0333771 [Helianthus annuus]